MAFFVTAPRLDAYENLARDELILNELAPGQVVLYLYVNAPAVIIGRNQNPYIECDMSKLEADGVRLARRISGGGAVYHDEGNLNYSFIAASDSYDEARQSAVLMNALKHFGIEAEKNGRNDLVLDGRKFGGMAFAQRGMNRLQHGTLLVSGDLNAMPRYLTPSKLKLEAKGVKSVRARVCNLNEFAPALSVEKLKTALYEAYEREYGKVTVYPFGARFVEAREKLTCERASRQWIMGESPSYDAEMEMRVDAGSFRLCFNIKNGKISACRVYSDCLNETLPPKLESSLQGLDFEARAMANAVRSLGEELNDLARRLGEMRV